MADKSMKTQRIQLRIPEDDRVFLEEEAEHYGISISEVVRAYIATGREVRKARLAREIPAKPAS